MYKNIKNIIEISSEINRILSENIEICPKSPIHEKLEKELCEFKNKTVFDFDKIKEETEKILLKYKNGNIDNNTANKQLFGIYCFNNKIIFTKHEIDFAYLVGVFNTGGIDALSIECQRLKSLNKNPSDLIISSRE